MAYSNDSIAMFVSTRLNQTHFIPDIQRDFEWGKNPQKVYDLFDSIMMGFPIGTFLFWDAAKDTIRRDDILAYKVIDDYKRNHTTAGRANIDSLERIVLILDGQQRLTSLLVGLKGFYSVRAQGASQWRQQKLFIDLFCNPLRDRDDDEPSHLFAFKDIATIETERYDGVGTHYWFEVGSCLQWIDEKSFSEAKKEILKSLPPDIGDDLREQARDNLSKLRTRIWAGDNINFYTYPEQDYEKVSSIFIRTNSGGVPLDKADLLLTSMTVNWEQVGSAREEVANLLKYLNEGLPSNAKNRFKKDFILKSCLVLPDLPIRYKVENFTKKENIRKISDNWPQIKSALEKTVNFVNSIGIDGRNLAGANTLIPIAYYFLKFGSVPVEPHQPGANENVKLITRWLLSSILNGLFSTHSDTALDKSREVLRKLSTDTSRKFPELEINLELQGMGRLVGFTDLTVQSILELEYNDAETFFALSLLTLGRRWGREAHSIDHIHPQSYFNGKGPKSAIYKASRNDFDNNKNMIGNLAILTAAENSSKNNMEPLDWHKSLSPERRRELVLPLDEELYEFANFPSFVSAREVLLRKRFLDLMTELS